MALELPSAQVQEESGGVNPVDIPPDDVCVFIGPCSKGPLNQVYQFNNYNNLATTFGCGPMVKAAAYAIAKGATVLVVKIPATAVAGFVSTPDLSAFTNPSAFTSVSGTPIEAASVVLVFGAGGTVGSPGILYEYSLDGGVTYGVTTALGTATSFAIPELGVTVNLVNGQAITTDDEVRFYTVPSFSSLQAATIARVGSSTSTPTITGTPEDDYEVVFEVTRGGTIGVYGVEYRYSLDGGLKFTPPRQLGTATSVQLLDGAEDSGLDINFPPIVAVAATGSITAVAGASLVDGETFTLSDGTNPPKVFEFDSNASVQPGAVAISFTGGDSAATVRTAMIAAINGASSLNITASPGTGTTINLVNDNTGAAGNIAIADTVANAGFVVSGMSGGVDASTGTLERGDIVRTKAYGPGIAAADVTSAIGEVDTQNLYAWSFLHVVGNGQTQTTAATIGGELDNLEASTTGATFTMACLSARDKGTYNTDTSWSNQLVAEYETLVNDRLAVGAGYARITCPLTGRRNRRPMAWILVSELIRREVQEDPGRVGAGALSSDVSIYDTNNVRVEHDALVNSSLHAARFCTLRTYKRRRGIYITRGNLFSEETSDISRIPLRRVMNKASEIFRQVMENQLENDLFANAAGEPNPGALRETDASAIDREIRVALEAALVGEVSSISVRTSRTDPVLTNGGRLSAEVRITGLAYIDQFVGKISYVNPALAAIQVAA